MTADSLVITPPAWLLEYEKRAGACAALEARMSLCIAVARENIGRGGGGPFAAGVFEQESGRVVALGVNMVATAGLSVLHAEIMALSRAQRRLGTFDLSAGALPPLELVTTAAPCAMCLGAVPWSGVGRLVCGARGEDVEAVGFDEGAKPADWEGALKKRGIKVVSDILRAEAARVLSDYGAEGGEIYNPKGRPGRA